MRRATPVLAQVSLKWAVQQGIPVVPKSSNPSHQAQNLALFDFELTDEVRATALPAVPPAAPQRRSTTDLATRPLQEAATANVDHFPW